MLTLDAIEKDVIGEFNDARALLALGRGAVGGPRLKSEAFTRRAARFAAADDGERARDEARSGLGGCRRTAGSRSTRCSPGVKPIFTKSLAERARPGLRDAQPARAQRARADRSAARAERVGVPPQEHLSHGLPRFRLEAERPDGTLVGSIVQDCSTVQRLDGSRIRWKSRNRHGRQSRVGPGGGACVDCRGRERRRLRAWCGRAHAGDRLIADDCCRRRASGDGGGRRVDRSGRHVRRRNGVAASSAASTWSSTTSASRKAPSIEATTDADWQEAFDQTLFPAIRMSRLAVPHIRKRGGGAIVIVSSIFGRESGGRMTYNAVKAAEISLTKSLAQQLAKDQIRVVSVAPGSIMFEGGSWWKRQQSDPEGIAQVRQAGAAVRAIRQARRSRRRDRVSRVTESELDQRHYSGRGRLPVADVLGVLRRTCNRPAAPAGPLRT